MYYNFAYVCLQKLYKFITYTCILCIMLCTIKFFVSTLFYFLLFEKMKLFFIIISSAFFMQEVRNTIQIGYFLSDYIIFSMEL